MCFYGIYHSVFLQSLFFLSCHCPPFIPIFPATQCVLKCLWHAWTKSHVCLKSSNFHVPMSCGIPLGPHHKQKDSLMYNLIFTTWHAKDGRVPVCACFIITFQALKKNQEGHLQGVPWIFFRQR